MFWAFALKDEIPADAVKKIEEELAGVTADPQTPPRPPKKPKTDLGISTPEEKSELPTRVQNCRPATFGQPKPQEAVLRPVSSKKRKPESATEGPAEKRQKVSEPKDDLDLSDSTDAEARKPHRRILIHSQHVFSWVGHWQMFVSCDSNRDCPRIVCSMVVDLLCC